MRTRIRPHDSGAKKIRENIYKRDVFGRTVLHVAVLCNQPDLLGQVLRYPEAKLILLATDCENGWNLLHYILYHKRIRCLVVLLDYLKRNSINNHSTILELLKKKDRCGTPPIFLLQNDIKDFVWLPIYVNEKSEYHLEKRFPDNRQENSSPRKRRSWQIDHLMWNEQRGGSDIYVMGSNVNHSLGVVGSAGTSAPVKLPHCAFREPSLGLQLFLRKTRFKDVKISKYHSVLLTTDGRIFTCGLASMGRLGTGISRDNYQFTKVDLFEKEKKEVSLFAISTGHNLALTSSNEVYSWGLNEYCQLGFLSSEVAFSKKGTRDFEGIPSPVVNGDLRKVNRPIIGLAASKIHSIVYTSDSIFTWGLNIGQMGFPPDNSHQQSCNLNGVVYKGKIVNQPRAIAFKERIKLVTTCETATCVVTEANDLFVFILNHRFKLPKLPLRSGNDAFDIYKPSRLTSAPVVQKVVMRAPENVIILLESGDVLTFSINTNIDSKAAKNLNYSYLWRAYDTHLRAVDIDGSYDGSIVLCTRDGSVFRKEIHPGLSSMKLSVMPSLIAIKNKYKKVEGVNKVVRVTCDELFTSFGFVRDEVDMLPLKLQKNDFRKDLAYLSIMNEADAYRKQDQLLDSDHHLNCYVTDYLIPMLPKAKGNLLLDQKYEHDDVDDPRRDDINDNFKKYYNSKHLFSSSRHPSLEQAYQSVDDDDEFSSLYKLLDSEAILRTFLKTESFTEKMYDSFIEFNGDADLRVGFHRKILKCRSEFFHRISRQDSSSEYFIHDFIKGYYDTGRNVLVFETDVDLRATLIFLHFIYTNRVIKFWDAYPSGLACPTSIKRTKEHFRFLMDLFRMDEYYGKDEQFIELFRECTMTESSGDLSILLHDGQVRCDSYFLAARSAFFETFLSERWDSLSEGNGSFEEEDAKFINLEGISKTQFEVILRHIYGCNDLNVFDGVLSLFIGDQDSDDFINFLLDMIEITDQLLLLQLKHLCELAIKDMITVDNALILLQHAHHLSASTLFKCCSWIVFNNLEIVIFDGTLTELDTGLLSELERELKYLQLLKDREFVVGESGELNKCLLRTTDGPQVSVDAIMEFGDEFNDYFLTSDLKFQPIFDHKPESLDPSDEKKHRSSSRRHSRKESMTELRKEMEAIGLNSRQKSEDTSAVAEDSVEEKEFEVVTSRRRQKSRGSVTEMSDSSRENSVNGSKSVSASPPISVPTNVEPVNDRSQLVCYSPSAALGPVLGDLKQQGSKQKTKIKFTAPKPSQKERRRGDQALLGKSDEKTTAANTNVALKNPWKPISTPPPRGTDSRSIQNLPVLGSTVESFSRSSSSMTAIMLEEALNNENKKNAESERRSLQDIQREQEFAKWWEEESRRVQNEMKILTTLRGSTSKGSGSRGGGRRRGSRQNELKKKIATS